MVTEDQDDTQLHALMAGLPGVDSTEMEDRDKRKQEPKEEDMGGKDICILRSLRTIPLLLGTILEKFHTHTHQI